MHTLDFPPFNKAIRVYQALTKSKNVNCVKDLKIQKDLREKSYSPAGIDSSMSKRYLLINPSSVPRTYIA